MSAFPPLFAVDRTVLKRTYDYSTTGSIAFHVIMVNNNVVDVRNNDMRHVIGGRCVCANCAEIRER